MSFQKGNTYHEYRKKIGRERIFSSPDELLQKCIEYFQWVDENPLKKPEIVKYKEHAELMEVPVCRAYTKARLADFCQVSCYNTIAEYKKYSDDFSKVITYVEGKIYNQKFENAAAGLLNSNIISRDLGLRDEVNQTVDATIDNISDLTPEQRAERINKLKQKLNAD